MVKLYSLDSSCFFLSEYLNLKQFLGIILSELGCQSKICKNCTKYGILLYMPILYIFILLKLNNQNGVFFFLTYML